MANREQAKSQKKGFWDLLKASTKELGILFPGEGKSTHRPAPKPAAREAVAPPTAAEPPSSLNTASTDWIPAPEVQAQDNVRPTAEIIQELMPDLDGERIQEMLEPKEVQVHGATTALAEDTERYLKQIQAQLSEIRRGQMELEQNREMIPMVVENALEKFFYWVQERENQQMDLSMKEVEQRLNSGQLEILMEIRSLVDQSEKLAFTERQLAKLERENDKQKSKTKVFGWLLTIVCAGVGGAAWWLWSQGFLPMQLPW